MLTGFTWCVPLKTKTAEENMIQERKYTEKDVPQGDNTIAPKESTSEKQQPTQNETITDT